jgi:drug/metabolite transporter (DMT)-like permease
MNYAANHVSLFTLNIVIVLEPAVGIAIGALLFGATVTATQLAGGVLLSAAVVFGMRKGTVGETAPAETIATP